MRRDREAGQALVFVALGMVLLSAVLGLAVDIGYMRFLKRRIQTAADSAAIAAAAEINYGDVTAAAKADAASNGFTDQANGVTITVNNPPASGPNQGVQGYVEVLISKSQPTFFIRVVPGGSTSSTVTARAVGRLGNAKGCMYSLQSSLGGSGVTIHHGSVVNAQNCAIIDNGNLTVHSGATLTASAIGVGGTVSNFGSPVTPTPQTGMVLASDPLAYLAAPATGPCTTLPTINSGTVQVFQGDYCAINVTGNGNVNFNPGTYVINGNGVPCNGGPPTTGFCINTTGTVTGAGVTFYNTNNTAVTIHSAGSINLTAPASGAYAGILFFQDRSNSSGATVNGGNSPRFEGALYFPNFGATLTLNGIGTSPAIVVVAGSIVTTGGTNGFSNSFSVYSTGSPIKDAVLAE